MAAPIELAVFENRFRPALDSASSQVERLEGVEIVCAREKGLGGVSKERGGGCQARELREVGGSWSLVLLLS